jgi:peptidoglycan biosynthesis protein MviN/MurJ (putative lipid II flippase)
MDANVIDTAARLTVEFYHQRKELQGGLDWPTLVDVLAALLGAAVMLMCVCRMSQLTQKHRLSVRMAHAALFSGAFCLAWAPFLFGAEHVRMGAVLFSLSVLGYMWVTGTQWRHGKPPRYLERRE